MGTGVDARADEVSRSRAPRSSRRGARGAREIGAPAAHAASRCIAHEISHRHPSRGVAPPGVRAAGAAAATTEALDACHHRERDDAGAGCLPAVPCDGAGRETRRRSAATQVGYHPNTDCGAAAARRLSSGAMGPKLGRLEARGRSKGHKAPAPSTQHLALSTRMASATGTYVYCIVAAKRRPRVSRARRGLPGTRPVRLVDVEAGVFLAVADAPLDRYGEAAIHKGLSDLDWVSRAAVAHESIVESFVGETAVLPMKLFTIFTSDERALDHIRGNRAR